MQAAPTEAHADFGKAREGVAVSVYSLKNRTGFGACIATYGGILVPLKTPDRNGAVADVVLRLHALEGYMSNLGPVFGALIGRYENRIG